MTLKSKMIATISAFCLVLALLIIGVWAAQSVKVEMGGSLTFKADDVNVRIEGSVEGAEVNPTLSTLVYSAEESPLPGDIKTWQNNALTFGRTDESVNDIVITIKITNLSKENAVNIKVKDTIGSSVNVTKTVQRDGAKYNLGEPYTLSKSTDSESTATFTITFSVANKTQSVSGVKYGYIIDLSDESYDPETVVSNNEALGAVDYIDNKDGTITLIAKPTDQAYFVGWKDDTDQFINVNTIDYLQQQVFSGFSSSGVSVNQFFNNYFVDYYQIDDENPSFETLISQANGNSANIDPMLLEAINYEADNVRNNYHRFDYDYYKGDSFTAVFTSKESVSTYTLEADFDYMIFDDVDLAVVTKYKGSSTEIIIPNQVNEKTIIGIYQNVSDFSGPMMGYTVKWCPTNITKVTLPETFLSFGMCEYYGLPITQINFPNSLTAINGRAFYGCDELKSDIFIPEKMQEIEEYAFGINLRAKSLTFAENSKLKIIHNYAFSELASVTSVNIPNKVEYIGKGAFNGLSVSITSMIFTSEKPPMIGGEDAINFNTTKIYVPESAVEIYKNEISWQEYADRVYSINKKIEDENFIYHINDNDSLEIIRLKNNVDEISIPTIVEGKSVTSIGDWSFSWYYISNLENVIIPESIVSIGQGAFDGCDKLLSVTFENPNGWQVSSDGTSGWTSVNEDLSNSTTAKDCLVNTYRTYYWKRV